MDRNKKRRTGFDPTNPATPNVNLNQRRAASPDSSMTGIIVGGVILLIVAIVAFNYGWFGGSDAPSVTQDNTTETVPQATAPDTTTSTTVAEPDTSTSTSTTTTEPSGTGTGTATTTDP